MQAQQWRVVVKHKIALSPFDELDLGLNLEFLCDYHDIEVLEKRKPISGSYNLPEIEIVIEFN